MYLRRLASEPGAPMTPKILPLGSSSSLQPSPTEHQPWIVEKRSELHNSLDGAVAIVSGSCSGIGAAVAQELSSLGVHVVVNYPSEALLLDAQKVLDSLQTPGVAIQADLSTIEGPVELVKQTMKYYDRIDVLINNAGVAINAPFEEQTMEHWDRIVNLNARGTFLLTQAVLPHLPRTADGGGGRIVNVVSVSSRAPPAGQTIYAGSKGMVDSFTRCWARELPPKYGCTVNSVSPGPVRTPAFTSLEPDIRKQLQESIDSTPCGARMAEPSEIAHAIAFLCQDASRWVNGAHLLVNGGIFID